MAPSSPRSSIHLETSLYVQSIELYHTSCKQGTLGTAQVDESNNQVMVIDYFPTRGFIDTWPGSTVPSQGYGYGFDEIQTIYTDQ